MTPLLVGQEERFFPKNTFHQVSKGATKELDKIARLVWKKTQDIYVNTDVVNIYLTYELGSARPSFTLPPE